MGDQHLWSGVVTGALVAVAVDLPADHAVLFVAVTAVAALLPDMDHPDATMPRALMWPGRALAAVIGAIFGHRTLTHSVVGVGLLCLGMAVIPRLPTFCYLAVILGCVTHIIGDMITVSGVPLFWPHKHEFRIARMRAGGHFEMLVVAPLLMAAAAWAMGRLVMHYA